MAEVKGREGSRACWLRKQQFAPTLSHATDRQIPKHVSLPGDDRRGGQNGNRVSGIFDGSMVSVPSAIHMDISYFFITIYVCAHIFVILRRTLQTLVTVHIRCS